MFDGWPRCIICVDMNAFFASIEQLLQPRLRDKPIAITNGDHGSCIITASYAARAFGIKTGMTFSYARLLCPHLIQVPSRSAVYEHYSKRLMQLLYDQFTPDIEVFSVDEAFLDMSYVYHRYATPRLLAQSVCDQVFRLLHLPCSVGISGDKTTAKYAAKLHKPMGVTVIEPSIARSILSPVSVSELCGIGPRTQRYLAKFGATNCGSVSRIPVSLLTKKFGIKGQRLWLMCAGKDPDMVRTYVHPAKTMGHSKILPPGVSSQGLLLGYLDAMAFKLCYRMLMHKQFSAHFVCKIHFLRQALLFELTLIQPICHYELLSAWILRVGEGIAISSPVKRVQITALDLVSTPQQDLFYQQTPVPNSKVDALLMSVNRRFGKTSLMPARLTSLLPRIQSTNVISPSWKGGVPVSSRQTIWD